MGESRSVSQYRLPRRKGSVSSGRASTGVTRAAGATVSGRPVSFTNASAKMWITPAGARIRVHQLPKRSRYPDSEHLGCVHTRSGMTTSDEHDGRMFSIRIIGVARGHEYVRL